MKRLIAVLGTQTICYERKKSANVMPRSSFSRKSNGRYPLTYLGSSNLHRTFNLFNVLGTNYCVTILIVVGTRKEIYSEFAKNKLSYVRSFFLPSANFLTNLK